MTGETQTPTARILARLRDLVEGRTTCAEMSRCLGWPENALARFFNRELRFDLKRVEKVLKAMNLSLQWFLNWCLEDHEREEPEHILLSLCPPAQYPGDPFLTWVESRFPDVLDLLEHNGNQSDSLSMPRQVEAIEELRFSDRSKAKEKIEECLRGLLDHETPDAGHATAIACSLSVWAAIQRTRDLHGHASAALAMALKLSRYLRLTRMEPLLLQRASYVLRDLGELHEALRFSERALLRFACHADQRAVGRCLVDRGILLHHLLDDLESIASFQEALALLGNSDWRNRAAAHQYIAEGRLRLGDLEVADQAIDQALRLFEDRDLDVCLGHAHFSKARIRSRQGDDTAAASHYRHALHHLISSGGMSVDIALVALDLARILVRRGDLQQLRELACQVQGLSPALRSSPIADRVLMEFVRVARYGNVTALVLGQLRQKLESAAEK